jgi:hypothetical protein
MQTKYTNDGKKVAIVGKLNADQSIVQEIFITKNGQEIPSGENFVVTSLHDQPVKKWSTYYQDRCAQEEKECEYKLKQIQEQNRRLYDQLKRYKENINSLRDGSPIDFAGFLAQASSIFDPENKWVVIKDYSRWYLYEYENLFQGSYGISVKVYLSGVNKKLYVTTSDSNYTDFAVFPTKEAAAQYIKDRILSSASISDEDLKIAEKIGIELPTNLVNDFKSRKLEEKNKQLKEAMDRVVAIEKEIQERFQ